MMVHGEGDKPLARTSAMIIDSKQSLLFETQNIHTTHGNAVNIHSIVNGE